MRKSILAVCMVIIIISTVIFPVAAGSKKTIVLDDVYNVVTAIQQWTTTAGNQLTKILSNLATLQSDVSSIKTQVNDIHVYTQPKPTPTPIPTPIKCTWTTTTYQGPFIINKIEWRFQNIGSNPASVECWALDDYNWAFGLDTAAAISHGATSIDGSNGYNKGLVQNSGLLFPNSVRFVFKAPPFSYRCGSKS